MEFSLVSAKWVIIVVKPLNITYGPYYTRYIQNPTSLKFKKWNVCHFESFYISLFLAELIFCVPKVPIQWPRSTRLKLVSKFFSRDSKTSILKIWQNILIKNAYTRNWSVWVVSRRWNTWEFNAEKSYRFKIHVLRK